MRRGSLSQYELSWIGSQLGSEQLRAAAVLLAKD